MRISVLSVSIGVGLFAVTACARTQSGSDSPSSMQPDAGVAGSSGAPSSGAAGKSGAGGSTPRSAGRSGGDATPPPAGAGGNASPAAGRSGGGAGQATPAAGSGGTGGLPRDSCPKDVAVPAICRVCADGSCGVPVCKDGKPTGAWTCPNDPQGGSCVVGGCSNQLCTEGPQSAGSTCEWREEYACYRDATCERQSDGKCGWTQTPELTACLENPGGGDLHWYMTCGDPVCRSDSMPSDDPKIPNCTTQQLGDACSNDGELCDGVATCGAKFICSTTDPSKGPCPISRARFKEGVEYLTAEQRREYRDQLLSMPLASYRYVHAPKAGPQLGFVIEDVEPSVAVSGDHVNMYGYLSMAVAALQEQQAEITGLRRELADQRASLRALTEARGAESAVMCEP